jgi:hypothetical protein
MREQACQPAAAGIALARFEPGADDRGAVGPILAVPFVVLGPVDEIEQLPARNRVVHEMGLHIARQLIHHTFGPDIAPKRAERREIRNVSSLSLFALVFFMLVMIGAFAARSAAGFGAVLIAMPMLAFVLPISTAVSVTTALTAYLGTLIRQVALLRCTAAMQEVNSLPPLC